MRTGLLLSLSEMRMSFVREKPKILRGVLNPSPDTRESLLRRVLSSTPLFVM